MNPLWQPSAARVQESRITAFQRMIENRHGISFANYREFHQWSCVHADDFWQAVWDEAGLIGDLQGRALSWRRDMPPAATAGNRATTQLNFAENLLRHAARADGTDRR